MLSPNPHSKKQAVPNHSYNQRTNLTPSGRIPFV